MAKWFTIRSCCYFLFVGHICTPYYVVHGTDLSNNPQEQHWTDLSNFPGRYLQQPDNPLEDEINRCKIFLWKFEKNKPNWEVEDPPLNIPESRSKEKSYPAFFFGKLSPPELSADVPVNHTECIKTVLDAIESILRLWLQQDEMPSNWPEPDQMPSNWPRPDQVPSNWPQPYQMRSHEPEPDQMLPNWQTLDQSHTNWFPNWYNQPIE